MPKHGSPAASLARWALGRLALRAAALFVVMGAVFIAVDRLPGDAAQLMLGVNRTDASVKMATERLGLDDPVIVRYLRWIGQLVRGELGVSVTGQPITSILAASMPITAVTTGIALLLTTVLSLILGMWWGTRRQRSVKATMVDTTTTALIALPEFVIGTFLIAFFSFALGVLPAVTIQGPQGVAAPMYILPVVALLIPQVAWNSRIIRSATVDVLGMPHVRAAQLSGVRGGSLLVRHILPLVAPTAATSVATTSGVMIAGTVAVETLFNHPGVGLVIAGAVNNRDIPVLVTTLTVTGSVILVILTIADLLRVALIPHKQV